MYKRQLLVLGGGLAFYYLLSPLWLHGCFLALEALGGTGGGAFFAGLTEELPLGIPFSPVSYTHLDVYKRQRYQSLEGMLEAIGLPPEQVCTYWWSGKE